MSEVNLLVQCTREQQIEIENICVTKNLSISEYFMNLHEVRKKPPTITIVEGFDMPEESLVSESVLVKKPKKKKSFLDND